MKFNPKITKVKFEGFLEESQREREKQENVTRNRLFLILAFIFLALIVIVVRLSMLQVNQEDLYKVKLDTYGVQRYIQDAHRGTIEARDGQLLVTNETSINVIYYPTEEADEMEIELIVNFLYENIKIDVTTISEREAKDYFLIAFPKVVENLITKEDKTKLEQSSNYDRDLYNLQINLIDQKLMQENMSEEVLIKTKMITQINQTVSGSVSLVENITVEEASIIASKQSLLSGIEVQTDWQRKKIQQDSMTGILGRVSTKNQGLPAEYKEEYIAAGLQMDSKVGLTGLEKEYDYLLRGTNSTYTIQENEKGENVVELLEAGNAGTNLVLTIDWELQQLAEQAIINELQSMTTNPLFNEMFFILMDPNNGDILVMAGKQIDRDTGEIYDYADGNYKNAYLIGSTTKGGSIYSAYKHDLTYPGEIIHDAPMKIKGTPTKASWTNLGMIDDTTALARSSNVFMFHMAIRLGGGHYAYNQSLEINTDAFDIFRNDLGELGLGVKTGLDVPDESLGVRGAYENRNPGLLLDYFIGQYDSYTTIQLAQYTSTLANGGQRIQPRLVKDGYEIQSGGQKVTTYQADITMLDNVSHQEVAFDQIQKGYRACVSASNGLCRAHWAGAPYSIYAKTGSAQVFDYSNGEAIDYANLMTVGWGGSDEKADIVFASAAPRLNVGSAYYKLPRIVVDAYYEKYGIQ